MTDIDTASICPPLPTFPFSAKFLCSFSIACLLAIAGPCLAQGQDSTEPENNDADAAETLESPTSISVGNLSSNFSLSDEFNYDTNSRGIMISGSSGSLMFDYANIDTPNNAERSSRTTVGAEALFGGNAYLFRNFLRLPMDIYIPIRLNLDYRFMESVSSETSNLHRGAAGLGAGAGAELRFPVGPQFIQDNLMARGSAVVIPGVSTTLNSTDDENQSASPVSSSNTRMRRTIDFNIEVLLTELLGESAGVMVGYTFRTYSRSPQEPKNLGDVVDAATLSGDFIETSTQHMFRIGLCW